MLLPLVLLALALSPLTASVPHNPSQPRTPLPSAALNPNPSSASTSKRGLAYNAHSPPNALSLFSPPSSSSDRKISWAYNWNSALLPPPLSLPSKFEYVPQLQSLHPSHTKVWDTNVQKAIASISGSGSGLGSGLGDEGTLHLMSFNEPDLPTQANLSVQDAVDGYMTWMMPYSTSQSNTSSPSPLSQNDKAKNNNMNIRLGSPAISSARSDPNVPKGLEYLAAFLSGCEKQQPRACQVDFVAVHWYGCHPSSSSSSNPSPSSSPSSSSSPNQKRDTNACSMERDITHFKSHIQHALQTAKYQGRQLPVWVTEFATFVDPVGFLGEVLPWLDALDAVERYGGCGVSEGEGGLVGYGGGNGEGGGKGALGLSEVGRAYVS